VCRWISSNYCRFFLSFTSLNEWWLIFVIPSSFIFINVTYLLLKSYKCYIISRSPLNDNTLYVLLYCMHPTPNTYGGLTVAYHIIIEINLTTLFNLTPKFLHDHEWIIYEALGKKSCLILLSNRNFFLFLKLLLLAISFQSSVPFFWFRK